MNCRRNGDELRFFLASDYAEAPGKLLAEQRALTDEAIRNYDDLIGSGADLTSAHQKRSDAAAAGLDEVPAHRAAIDNRTASAADNLAFYSARVRTVMNLIEMTAQASADPAFVEEMVPFGFLTEAKEAGGLERALGGRLFAIVARTGEVPFPVFRFYYDRLAVEKTWTDKLRILVQDINMNQIIKINKNN